MSDLITTDLVRLDEDLGSDKHDVIRALAQIAGGAGRAGSVDQLVEDALAREATSPTGLPGGIAIPHCRTTGVDVPTLVFARLSPKVDFGAKDGPADIAFLIAAPAGGDSTHLQLLTKLARALVKPAFTNALRDAESAEQVVDEVNHALGVAPAGRTGSRHCFAATTAAPAAATPLRPRLPLRPRPPPVAGAAWSRSPPARPASRTPTWRPRPSRPRPNGPVSTSPSRPRAPPESTPLSHETIAAADAVIFAVDVGVRDRRRFGGKPVVSSGVKRPIDEADKMIEEALRYADDPNAPQASRATAATPRRRAKAKGSAAPRAPGADDRCLVHDPVRRRGRSADRARLPASAATRSSDRVRRDRGQQHALQPARPGRPRPRPRAVRQRVLRLHRRRLLRARRDGVQVPRPGAGGLHRLRDRGPSRHRARASSWARSPSTCGGFGLPQSGFLGGIIGGVLAGLVAHWISRWKVPTWARGLMPVLVIPLLATIDHRRPAHDRRPRQAARLADGGS